MAVENRWTASIWYVRTIPQDEAVRATADLLEGAILPGATQTVYVIPGTYRLVAETPDGAVCESPLLRLSAGERAGWVVEGV